ncbi:MAG TPA: hypothetical protein VHU62_15790 [Mycobacterium sp.]|nr:hypothetical protein [Mycobacterium sp.]
MSRRTVKPSPANPQIESDLKQIQQPVVDLKTKWGRQVTPTAVVEALQAL